MLEILVTTIEDQISETMQTAGRPFVPLLGTLFIFLACRQSLGDPARGQAADRLDRDRRRRWRSSCSSRSTSMVCAGAGCEPISRAYAKPTIVMLPLNIVSEITRTFSLMVRLFGNVLSGEFVIATVLALAGLFVPIPLMALEILIGLIQAYIFTVLAAVFIGAGIGSIERG